MVATHLGTAGQTIKSDSMHEHFNLIRGQVMIKYNSSEGFCGGRYLGEQEAVKTRAEGGCFHS